MQPRAVLHRADQTVVRLQCAVTLSSVQWVVDEIDFAFTYLQSPRVRLEIDSPGGDLDGLRCFLQHARRWGRDGRVLATHSTIGASSAAAIMLTFGTVGHRSAHADAQLTWHYSRVHIAASSSMTADALSRHHAALERADRAVFEQVLRQVRSAPQAPAVVHDDDFPDRLHRLWAADEPLSAACACAVGLIDEVTDV
ncbi:MAG: hypothetical protein MUE41_13930 [Gemmatimonadaceae bacterium]|nr:hypothetical protein [Gemmatimonadaceae bacterium]